MKAETKTLGTREIERFLFGFHDIADDQQSAYAGRLKHLTRGGFPPGVSVGPGVPARYNAEMFFKMVVVTELWQFGVPPARAIRLVSEAWPRLQRDVLQVWRAIDEAHQKGYLEISSIFWRVPVEALHHMARRDRIYSPESEDTLTVMTGAGAETSMKEGGYNVRRKAFIVAHQLIHDALTQLSYQLGGQGELKAFMSSFIADPVEM
jgi:hypothetical protein